MREYWRKCLNDWKKKLPLPALAVLAVGTLLLLIPSGTVSPPGEEEPQGEEVFELDVFERRLELVLSEISGAGETRVVLSLRCGSRQVLAQAQGLFNKFKVDSVSISTTDDYVKGLISLFKKR